MESLERVNNSAPSFVCECAESAASACQDLPFYREHEGRKYCVLHYPARRKLNDFALALNAKIDNKDFNFRGIWFPKIDFVNLHFDKSVDFAEAYVAGNSDFSGTHFEKSVDFSQARFEGIVNFQSAKFQDPEASNSQERYSINFTSVEFQKVNFSSALFDQDKLLFCSSVFRSEADFRRAKFYMGYIDSLIDFDFAVFKGKALFDMAFIDVCCSFRSTVFERTAQFTSAKLSGAEDCVLDFSGAVFRDADFSFARLYRPSFRFGRFLGIANFSGASFESDADFSAATFSQRADFSRSTFASSARFAVLYSPESKSDLPTTFMDEAEFTESRFRGDADFRQAVFNKSVSMNGAEFLADVDFSNATFAAYANLTSSTIASYIRFSGEENARTFSENSRLSLEHAWIKRPEHISFHALHLKPYWFINVDARKFEFIEVDWGSQSLKQEIDSMITLGKTSPSKLLSIAYRSLAVNAEENHRYGEASDLRYRSMDLQRRNPWKFSVLLWLYWLASGYGEKVTRAAAILLLLVLLFAAGYTTVGFARRSMPALNGPLAIDSTLEDFAAPLPWKRAPIYSLEVMALQKPEPRPVTTTAHALVIIETILGPVQAALLALAIRRRFMR